MSGPGLFCKSEIIDELSAVDAGSIRLAAISVIEDVRCYAKRLDPGDPIEYPPIDSMCLLLRDLEKGVPMREALNKLNDFAIKPLFEKFRSQKITVSITFRENMEANEESKYLDLVGAEALIHDLLTSSWNGRTIEIQVDRSECKKEAS